MFNIVKYLQKLLYLLYDVMKCRWCIAAVSMDDSLRSWNQYGNTNEPKTAWKKLQSSPKPSTISDMVNRHKQTLCASIPSPRNQKTSRITARINIIHFWWMRHPCTLPKPYRNDRSELKKNRPPIEGGGRNLCCSWNFADQESMNNAGTSRCEELVSACQCFFFCTLVNNGESMYICEQPTININEYGRMPRQNLSKKKRRNFRD